MSQSFLKPDCGKASTPATGGATSRSAYRREAIKPTTITINTKINAHASAHAFGLSMRQSGGPRHHERLNAIRSVVSRRVHLRRHGHDLHRPINAGIDGRLLASKPRLETILGHYQRHAVMKIANAVAGFCGEDGAGEQVLRSQRSQRPAKVSGGPSRRLT